jgi:hypothetical protein
VQNKANLQAGQMEHNCRWQKGVTREYAGRASAANKANSKAGEAEPGDGGAAVPNKANSEGYRVAAQGRRAEQSQFAGWASEA